MGLYLPVGLFILLLIALLMAAGFKTWTGRVRLSFRRVWQVTGVYLALLLASLAVFYALAASGKAETLPVPEKGPGEGGENEYDRILGAYYDALFKGRLEEYQGAELQGKWDFNYPERRLLVRTAEKRPYYGIIAVEEKAADDGRVEARYYNVSLGGGDLFPVNPPEVKLAGEVLEIALPRRKEFMTFFFCQDFTSAQFTGKGVADISSGLYIYHGDHQVLYLKVPRGLEIDTDASIEHSVTFIER